MKNQRTVDLNNEMMEKAKHQIEILNDQVYQVSRERDSCKQMQQEWERRVKAMKEDMEKNFEVQKQNELLQRLEGLVTDNQTIRTDFQGEYLPGLEGGHAFTMDNDSKRLMLGGAAGGPLHTNKSEPGIETAADQMNLAQQKSNDSSNEKENAQV